MQDFKADRAAGKTSMAPLSEAAIEEVDKAITADDTMNSYGRWKQRFSKIRCLWKSYDAIWPLSKKL